MNTTQLTLVISMERRHRKQLLSRAEQRAGQFSFFSCYSQNQRLRIHRDSKIQEVPGTLDIQKEDATINKKAEVFLLFTLPYLSETSTCRGSGCNNRHRKNISRMG